MKPDASAPSCGLRHPVPLLADDSSLSVPWTPTNFLALPPHQAALDSAAAVIIPVPIDSTTSFRSGARYGPSAIIAASAALEDYDLELGIDVAELGIHTTPPLEPHVGDPRQMAKRVQIAVAHYSELGKITAVIGGDHSAAIGSALAHGETHPNLSVLYIDAHADLRNEYQGSGMGTRLVSAPHRRTLPRYAGWRSHAGVWKNATIHRRGRHPCQFTTGRPRTRIMRTM